MTIYDLVTSTNIQVYWDTLTRERAPYWGETKFPNRKVTGLDLKWIKGRSEIPVVLRPSAFDVNVIPRNRNGLDMIRTQMPFFKESYYIDEELRQQLRMLEGSNNTTLINTLMEQIFDDASKLIEAAAVQRERMRMGILTTGVLAFAANGQAFEFDYGLDPDQLRDSTVAWSNVATADPIADITAAVDYLEEASDDDPAIILMNRNTFRQMKATDAVRNGIYVINNFVNNTGVIADSTVIDYVAQITGLRIEIYNKSYRNENGVVGKFVPDGVVTIMPDGALGYTCMGTTPEESDLMNSSIANVAIVDTGVAVTTMQKADPVSVETKVSMISMPSFERADSIVILDVTANA